MNKLIELDVGRDYSGVYPYKVAMYDGKELPYKTSGFLDGIARKVLHGETSVEPNNDRYWTGEMKSSSGYPRYFTLYLRRNDPPQGDPFDEDYLKYTSVLSFSDRP